MKSIIVNQSDNTIPVHMVENHMHIGLQLYNGRYIAITRGSDHFFINVLYDKDIGKGSSQEELIRNVHELCEQAQFVTGTGDEMDDWLHKDF